MAFSRFFTDGDRDHPGIVPRPPRAWVAWVVGCYALVWAVGFAATRQALGRWELNFLQYLSVHHTPLWDVVAMGFHYGFGPNAAVAWAISVSVVITWVYGFRRGGVFFVLVLWGWLSGQIVKRTVMRARPDPLLLADPLVAETTSFSYPSGHVSFVSAFVLALAFVLYSTPSSRFSGRTKRRLLGALVVVLIGFTAWSRMYVGVHYPSDVVMAVVNTSATMILALGVWNLVQTRVVTT